MRPQKLRVVVADNDPAMLESLRQMLVSLGHLPFPVQECTKLVEVCRSISPDLVIADVSLSDQDVIAAASEVSQHQPTPFILISGNHDSEFLDRIEGFIMAFLVKPVEQAHVEAAITVAMHRFGKFSAVKQERDQLLQTLEHRKVIERAKGALMKRLQIDEDEAYRRLRQEASNNNSKLVKIARRVLAAEKIFQSFERNHELPK